MCPLYSRRPSIYAVSPVGGVRWLPVEVPARPIGKSMWESRIGHGASFDFLNSQSLEQRDSEVSWVQILSVLDGLNTLFKRTNTVGDHCGIDFKYTSWREE